MSGIFRKQIKINTKKSTVEYLGVSRIDYCCDKLQCLVEEHSCGRIDTEGLYVNIESLPYWDHTCTPKKYTHSDLEHFRYCPYCGAQVIII